MQLLSIQTTFTMKYFILVLLIVTGHVHAQQASKEVTVKQYLTSLQQKAVTPNAEGSKKIAVEALARAIKMYCHSKSLTLAECEQSKMSDMKAYFEKQTPSIPKQDKDK